MGAPSLPSPPLLSHLLPFPSLPSPPLPYTSPPFPSRPLEVCPLNTARGLGSAVSSLSGVWGEAPADKRFGAYLSRKGQLWWQQFFVEFFARLYVIFIIFFTKIINLQKCVQNYHMITYGFHADYVVFQDYFERFGSLFPTLNI